MAAYDNIYDAVVALINPTIPIGAEYVGQLALPFARYVDLGATFDFYTRSSSDPLGKQVWSDSSFQISIFAATREQARSLGRTVMSLLNGYSVSYNDGRVVFLEPSSATFVPEPHIGPASPTVFHRAITFSFSEQRTI